MNQTPLERYQQLLKEKKIFQDTQQAEVIHALQTLYDQLTEKKSWLKKFFAHKKSGGLYLWGNVGIGKSFLMDLFFNSLPFPQKIRLHFHEFMREIHIELASLQGSTNPLVKIAKKWAAKTRIICFDEFMVNNIVDAMLVGELLKALYAENIYFIFTTNIPPDELYKNGLQRQRFLPAIDEIKKNSQVIHLKTISDYRLHFADKGKFYWCPLDELTQKNMEENFSFFSQQATIDSKPLNILGRAIPIIKKADGVVWFNFLDLCDIPRSQNDYLEIVKQFHTVLVSNLKPMTANQTDLAESFVKLIDILYDHKIRLIIAAAVSLEDLYVGGKLQVIFARTRSRLIEMQAPEFASQ